jgi:ABC-2 type transport system ATP-binding protein
VLVQGSYDEVRAVFTGAVTVGDKPVRAEWSWRRGRDRREYWPDAHPPPGATIVQPDLEDIIIGLSLLRRAAVSRS